MHLKNSHTGLGSWKSKLTALELLKEGATTLRPPPTKLGLKNFDVVHFLHISMIFMIYNIILIIINQTLIYAWNFRMEKEIGGLATSFHFQFLLLGSFGHPLPTPPHLLETQIQETRSQEQEKRRDPDHVTVSVVTQYSKCAVI